MDRIAILTNLALQNGGAAAGDKSTRRALTPDDVSRFSRLVRESPRKRVRVYSERGFVPNAYRWRCEIQFIERSKTGRISIGWTGAQRSHGAAPTATVNGRPAR